MREKKACFLFRTWEFYLISEHNTKEKSKFLLLLSNVSTFDGVNGTKNLREQPNFLVHSQNSVFPFLQKQLKHFYWSLSFQDNLVWCWWYMPVNKFTPLAINPNRRITCAEISKSKNSEEHVVYVILYNFAPVHDQCERYYLDKETGNMYMF